MAIRTEELFYALSREVTTLVDEDLEDEEEDEYGRYQSGPGSRTHLLGRRTTSMAGIESCETNICKGERVKGSRRNVESMETRNKR